MKITCYGATGSLPAPSRKGFNRIVYGGNTSCYYVEAGPFKIILDNGSGVAVLGNELMRNGVFGDFIVLQSHLHWDHVQGMPFAVPYYIGKNRFHFHGHRPLSRNTGIDSAIESLLSEQQATPFFPVPFDAMPSEKVHHSHSAQFSETFSYSSSFAPYKYYPYDDMSGGLDDHTLRITTVPLNHPDGCLGYVIEYMGKRIAYCTDNEPFAQTNNKINTLCKGVDLIILDGQYTDIEIGSNTQGFGHGTPSLCIKQAVCCAAKSLWIHHHDPNRSDDLLEVMETEAIRYSDATSLCGEVKFAREGDVLVI